jgi:hypothetical protein
MNSARAPEATMESDDFALLSNSAGITQAERYLAGCPQSGGGVHVWIFNAAMMCSDVTHWSRDEIIKRLIDATQGCGRDVPRDEIRRQVLAALLHVRGEVPTGLEAPHLRGKRNKQCKRNRGRKNQAPVPKWPTPDPELIAGVVALSSVKTVADLRALTHAPAPALSAEVMIDALFPGNPWLCVGMQNWRFGTRRKSSLLSCGSLCKFQLIVPSAMTRRLGPTDSGKLSEHAKSSVGPRQYLVVEADDGTKDIQAAVIWHLGGYLPLVCVVASRGKSLHGWFRCSGETEALLLEFYRYARLLGADTAAWGISQFVRLPGGTRKGKPGHPGNGKCQTVIYFNPQNTIQ